MSNEELRAKRRRHEDRVTLNHESLQRVDGWITQVTSITKGVTLSRKDMVNWVMKHYADSLSASDVADLKSQFFNEVRFLQQAIKEARAAKSRGEQVSLDAILGTQQSPAQRRVRSVRKRRTSNNTTDEAVSQPIEKTQSNVTDDGGTMVV